MNNRYNFKGEIMNKIIVFDLDSTLLNDYGEVSQYTSKVLTKLKNQGHILVVNTARSYPFAMNIIDFIKPDYSIVNGGAQIVDKNGKNIFLKPIEHQYVSAIVADIESVSKFAAVQTLDNLYTDSDKFLKQHPIRFDFKNEFPYDAYKILCDINQDIDAFKIAKKHHLDYVSYYDSTYKVFRHFDTWTCASPPRLPWLPFSQPRALRAAFSAWRRMTRAYSAPVQCAALPARARRSSSPNGTAPRR